MKTTVYTIAAILIGSSILSSQTATYNDVAVIININSASSESIGTYFAEKRNIPETNIIRISAPVTEEIDSLQFQQIRSQVESHLNVNGLVNSINYIVTTKGMPLKVKRFETMRCSSLESDLSLILGSYASLIGNAGRVSCPYYRQRNNFTRAQYGFYLVTRLDGYTVANVKSLIDRADVIDSHLPASGKFVFDMDPGWNTAAPYLNTRMRIAKDTLTDHGMNVLLDETDTYLVNQQNVNGYVGWGSNDKHTSYHGLLNFQWNTGAIAETYVSTSARTFSAPAVYGQSLIADIIAEGVTAVKGYVYEPYASAMADVSILFELYSDGYTVAESYYSASPFLSWMDVVIGDPKFRLVGTRLPADAPHSSGDALAGTLPVELTSFNVPHVEWFGGIVVEYGIGNEQSWIRDREKHIHRGYSNWTTVGFVQGHGTTNAPSSYSFIDHAAEEGNVSYRLKQIDRDGSSMYSEAVSVTLPNRGMRVSLGQNYPNPFNPSTSISFTVDRTVQTTLKVYSVTGQEIATLFNAVAVSGQRYSVQFNAQDLAAGMYLAVLQTPSEQKVQKMTLVK